MGRRTAYEPSLISVKTTQTAPPSYETSPFTSSAPVPPQSSGTALAQGSRSPQPSVPASSFFHNQQSSSQRVEEATFRTNGVPYEVYRKQLSSLYHGIALWEPSPIRILYDQVHIGDVGYVNEGFFYRMFNVTLPWDDPSNNRLGEPDNYKPLDWGPFANIRETTLVKGDYYSDNVSSRDNSNIIDARDAREWVTTVL
jgi:hypothetical protein